MSDWLAVGDETGNWDDLDHPHAFLGVTLVMGRIEDWNEALTEALDHQTITERLQSPPQYLTQDRQAKKHHLMDVFRCWQHQNLSGEWSLDAPGADPLRQEIFATLRWLAEHPRLVTLGLWLEHADIWRNLFRSGDPAVALGRAYGLLVGQILPFLNPEDRLLVHPGLRSEPAHLLAEERVSTGKFQANAETRQPGHSRGTVSVLIEEGQGHRDAWATPPIANFEAGTLDYLRQCSPLMKDIWLPNEVLNAVADLGAGLLRLSCQRHTRLCLRHDEAWRNVVFHALSEVTA